MERDIHKTLNDLPMESESISFKPEQMISCEKCGKANPPTRLSCFYCSAEIQISAEHQHLVKLNLRKPENWEKGFNIICLPGMEGRTESNLPTIARLLSIDAEILRQILELKKQIPLARLGSVKEAEAAMQNLMESGLRVLIVSDEILRDDQMPVRLRGIEFSEESFTLTTFNTGERKIIPRRELSLIVTGAIFELKIESFEKRKKKEIKVLNETQTSNDEVVIDLYDQGDPVGYRIPSKGFDFSCLGADKGLLAADNIRKLVFKLREFVPAAKFVDDYPSIREFLDSVWEVDRRKDFNGIRRTGFGRKDFTNVSTSNNLRQFTKYSRLQRHLL